MAKINEGAVMIEFFKQGDVPDGTKGIIKGEFAPCGKYENYTGVVEFENGVTRKVSLNRTSFNAIASKYGLEDTLDWIEKPLIFSIEDIVNKKTGAVYPKKNVFRPV